MSEFLIYNGKVAVLLSVFYLFYRLLMERETFHRLNRAVLLLSVLASYILPACIITTHQIVRMTAPLAEARDTEIATIQTSTHTSWPTVLLTVYLIGFAAKILHTILSTIYLHRFISLCEQHLQKDRTTIAVSEQNLAPFSWWNTIVLSRDDYETHDPALLAHEQAHIKSYHSVDILLMELVVALQWFNPAAWLMRRDLCTVHEYEADEAVLACGIDTHHYLSLLMERANATSRYALTNGISQKALRSRFLMMARHRSKPSHIFRLLYVLPVIGCALALNAQTVTDIRYLPATRTVKGYANDQNNNPIADVLVSVKGKEQSTVSDRNGEYYVNAADGDTIVWTDHGETELYQLKDTDNYVALVHDLPEAEQTVQTSKKVSVSGIVVDEQGEPIVGAVIKVRGQTLGTVSDYDGEFSIPVLQGSTIEVMYVGFGTESFICQEDMSNLNITLIKDNSDQ